MVSFSSVSLLLALVVVVNAATPQDGVAHEPEGPLDAPRPVGVMTLPAKWPEDWPKPSVSAPETGGKQRRETPDNKPASNRPVIKPLTSPPGPTASKPSTQPAVPHNRQELPRPAPQPHQTRPARDSPTPPPHSGQKPQPLPGTANTQKPQPLPAHLGLNGNRQGLTKPAPTPAKPAPSNNQKLQTQPSQTGLAGNRQGLTKPAPLPTHTRPVRDTTDEELKPQVLPAITGTQRPQTLPALIDSQKPQTLPAIAEPVRPTPLPGLSGFLRPQTIPAYVGTVKPLTSPDHVSQQPLILVDPIPPHLANPSAIRPERESLQSTSSGEENRPQALPALVNPPKPQTLPPIGTQPVLTGNRDSLLRPAPLPEKLGPQ